MTSERTGSVNTTACWRWCVPSQQPELGTHRGLPVTVIATATVQQLQERTGHAVTAGGTLLPIADLIRMVSHAYHYLSLFDGVDGR